MDTAAAATTYKFIKTSCAHLSSIMRRPTSSKCKHDCHASASVELVQITPLKRLVKELLPLQKIVQNVTGVKRSLVVVVIVIVVLLVVVLRGLVCGFAADLAGDS